jgi:hypothetical protein
MQTRFVIFVGLGALLVLLWKFVLAVLVGGTLVGGYYWLKSPSKPVVEPTAVGRLVHCRYHTNKEHPDVDDCLDDLMFECLLAEGGPRTESECLPVARRKYSENLDQLICELNKKAPECERLGKSK